ncbi:hypothetical protein EIP86_005721 [Pleurotus ostreatoroseus]|nr:hypothetical protein EIP86_005721 [Pleurotus ostreatoroseus]
MNTWNGPPYTCSSLIDMLAVMPLIETLSLGWTEVIMDSSGEAEAVASLSLPRLRNLQLTALDPTFISDFLDLLHIPGTACLEVTFFATQSPNLTEVDAWPVLRSFASILSPSRRLDLPPPIPTLQFEIAMDSLRLIGYRTQISHKDHLISTWREQPSVGEVSTQAFVLEIPFALIGGIGLGEIMEILPLQDAHILWLRSNTNGVPTPPLSTLSASMPRITEIHSVAVGFECFLSDVDSLISPSLPWPQLTSLVFDTLMPYSYDFHECTCYGNNARGCKCLQRFRNILKFRSTNGCAKLTRLSAHDSWFSTYDRSYIEELLAECADEIVIDELPPTEEMEDTD